MYAPADNVPDNVVLAGLKSHFLIHAAFCYVSLVFGIVHAVAVLVAVYEVFVPAYLRA